MYRTELINQLLVSRQGSRYLEIGVEDERQNFAQVVAPVKVGVDVKPVTTFRGTSDQFFAQNEQAFDLIFIDGLHVESQVHKDIENSYRCLAPGGVIVLHDCLPPDAWHQRPPEAAHEGENWNGDVWKAVLREFNRTAHRCCVVATDWGCGVIDTSRRQDPANDRLPDVLRYEREFDLLRRYVVTVPEFIREQVTVFYHLACLAGWEEVFAEQMHLLSESGYRALRLSVVGAQTLERVNTICEAIGVQISPIFQSPELALFETPCLRAIEDYARNHVGYVLYLHSKGVSDPANELKRRWRRLMMTELVGAWESRMLELPHYDAIGVNWREMPPISHFSGNFWYASTNYLRTLADFETYYEHPHYTIWDAIEDKRLGCEFWISSGPAEPRVLSLVCRNTDFLSPEFWSGARSTRTSTPWRHSSTAWSSMSGSRCSTTG